MQINLTASNETETRVLDYLRENASEALIEKINSGTKTISGALKFAQEEAKKLASGESCVCIDDATVFGWIVHFFEEESITEAKKTPAVRAPWNATPKPVAKPTPKAKATAQPSMLDALFGG